MTVRVHFTRPGKRKSEYTEQLVIDRPDVKILLLDGHPLEPAYENDNLILGRDAPIVWFIFPNRWYEVGRFHTADERLTGWYTNLCTPFEFQGNEWSTTDLFLDFWQTTDGSGVWLDEDEWDTAVADGLVDDLVQQRVRHEKEAISRAHANDEWPPTITREIDLAIARRELGR